MRTRVFLAAMLLLVPALARAQNREHLQINADLRMLHEQVARLQLVSNQLADEFRAIARRLDTQTGAQQKHVADLQLLINSLSTAVNTVREKLDDNSVRVSQLVQELPGIRSGLTMLADQLNTLVSLLQPPVNPLTPDQPAAGPPSSLGTVRLPESPTRLFEAAKSDYISNRLDNAIEGFTEFVAKFPDAPTAAEAQFWIGQSYYLQRKFKEALAAYDTLIATYKNAAEVPDAHYQKGLCYLDMGQRVEARRTFELIVKTFPGTASAMLAAQKLAAPATTR